MTAAMNYTAEIKYRSTGELVVTGTSNGKGEPSYEFAPDLDLEIVIALEDTAREAYEVGLYGTGSPGQVRDMTFAMLAIVEAHDPLYKLVIPKDTQKKIDKEAKADLAALPDGAVF